MTLLSTATKVILSLCLIFTFTGTVFADGSTFYKVNNLITGEERLEEHRHAGEKITVIDTLTKRILYTIECSNERSLCVSRDDVSETTISHLNKIKNLKNRESIRSMVYIKSNNDQSLVVIGVTVTMVQEQDKKWIMVKSLDNTNYINTLIGPSDDYRRPDYSEHIIVNPDNGLPISHEISVRTDIEI
jgi:hypothetical protein